MRQALLWLASLTLAACADGAGGPVETIAEPGPVLHYASLPASANDGLTLRVMTYNVAGLPAPLKSGRAKAMRAIGDALGDMRDAGEAPHIVFLQEAFMDAPARELIERAGYAYAVRGPERSVARPGLDASLGGPRRDRGEGLGAWLNGGLYILSDFPISDVTAEAFDDCAGFDCLANKGVLAARIHVPGAPEPVQVFTTHMNSRKASKAPLERAHAAHRLQAREMKAYLSLTLEAGAPVIYGGDFNMKKAPVRLRHTVGAGPYAFTRSYCEGRFKACDVSRLSEREAGLLDTQDLQGFQDGARTQVRPVRLMTMFSEYEPDALSDHSAYVVDYRLSWPDEARLRTASLDDFEGGNVFQSRLPAAAPSADYAAISLAADVQPMSLAQADGPSSP